MTSVDELFKKPGLPSKRKLEISHDPSEYYKSAKTTTNGDAKGKTHASVEEDDEDMEAGPTLPPDDEEEDYGPDDDEDGRFFGGGVEASTAAAMDFLDERDKEVTFVEEVYDVKWVRGVGVKFEKAINKNQELRTKFEDDPQKFMTSEADLDAQIKDLSILSEHPELYQEFAEQGCVASLVSLLAHENADIAIDAIQVLSELVDTDMEAELDQWLSFVNAALEADLLDLLSSNFSRLDELQELDRSGIYNALSILESLGSIPTTSPAVGKETKILAYLFERIKKMENPISQNKLYAAEVLSILVQTSPQNQTTLANADAINMVLELLAAYRRRDPQKDTEEEEFVENLFDALTSLVDSPEGKTKFILAEGVELALIMLREGKMAKPRALRVLDHAVGGAAGGEVCMKVVEKQGLKTIFGMFMKKQDNATNEHLLGIFAAMLRTLPGESAERIRLLAKFMEKEYEKIGKLVDIRRQYSSKLAGLEEEIGKKRKVASAAELEIMEPGWFTERLDAGLFVLQIVDTILAWLAAEDGGARKKLIATLADRDEGLSDIKRTLQEQMDGVTDEGEEAQGLKEMLGTLIEFTK